MKKIIIADDSQTARMIVKRCLQMIGFQDCEFMEATDGARALEMAAGAAPDLIIADLNMPNLDGEAMLAGLKSDPRIRSIPVIIVSSALNPSRRERLNVLGVAGAVNKPLSPASLKAALGALAA